MDSLAIAAQLREISSLLSLEGDKHRSRAYDRAARTVEAVHDLEERIASRRLTELPNIGDSLAGVIEELSRRGTVDVLERLRTRWPRLVVELSRLAGLGPVRAAAIHAALAPIDLDDLAVMARAGRIRELPGFGPAREARLLEALEHRDRDGKPLALAEARQLAAGLAAYLAAGDGVHEAAMAGPARRWIEISDRIALAAAGDPDAVVRRLEAHPMIAAVTRAPGAPVERLHVRLSTGVACEVVAAPRDRYGTALLLATGSDEHIDILRRRAAGAGLDLASIAAPDEVAVYRALGLPWLPPEVRDGTDEVAAADAGDDFADLVSLADIAGSVHCHTTYSDGKNTVEEMARAAQALGHKYITITDHSPTAHYAGGLTVDRLNEQWAEIAAVEEKVGIAILRGTESDIRVDGSLDYPDEILSTLDVVIASIHQRYQLDEDGMTRRLVAAMRQPVFKIWGHAFGRLLLIRDPIPCRFDEVLDAIAGSPVAIEINGDPRRLDLDPERARRARARGARFVLSSDAHSTAALGNVEYAVALARRARLRRSDVLNTLPPAEFKRAVSPRPG